MENNWPVKKLGEIAVFQKGKMMPNSSANVSGSIPYILIDDLRSGNYSHFTQSNQGTACLPTDSLLVWDGANAGTVGGNLQGFVGSTISKISPSQEIDPTFLNFLLSSKSGEFNKQIHGAAIPHLNKDFVHGLPVVIPPLSIQKKIVERLDAIRKAQELCDQQIQKTEELFESILEEFGKTHIGLVSKLEDLLVEPLQNGINFSKTQMGNGTLLVNVKDIYTENEIEEGKLERISITEKETKNYSLQDGDILFVRSSVKRDGVGFTAIFKPSLSEPIVYSGFIIRAKVDVRKILPQYLLYTTRSKHLRKRIIESSGTGTITNINQGSINRLQISVPDLKTQQEIVEKLEAVQNYKKLLQKEEELLKELFDSVLDKSMKGELDN